MIPKEHNDGWWIWCDATKGNVAMKQPTKEEAYVEAMRNLSFCYTLVRDERDELRKSLSVLKSAFAEVWPCEEEE